MHSSMYLLPDLDKYSLKNNKVKTGWAGGNAVVTKDLTLFLPLLATKLLSS